MKQRTTTRREANMLAAAEVRAARRAQVTLPPDEFAAVLLDYEVRSSWWIPLIHKLPTLFLRNLVTRWSGKHYVEKTHRKFKAFIESKEAEKKLVKMAK